MTTPKAPKLTPAQKELLLAIRNGGELVNQIQNSFGVRKNVWEINGAFVSEKTVWAIIKPSAGLFSKVRYVRVFTANNLTELGKTIAL